MDNKTIADTKLFSYKSIKVSRIPKKQVDLKNLALRVIPFWQSSNLTLLWKTPAQFELEVKQMENNIELKDSIAGNRKTLAKQMSDLDLKINKGVSRVKDYLNYKHKKDNAISYYEQFGIRKKDKGFRFPTDRDSRIESLKQMVASMEKYSPIIEEFDTIFWKNTQTEYDLLNKTLSESAGSISGNVKNKDNAMNNVNKVLISIIKLIEANYPDDSAMVLREWGFQKEKN